MWVIISVSGTSAKICPPRTLSCRETLKVTSQSFSSSREISPIPSGIKDPCSFFIDSRGLSIPSKIPLIIPGPSLTERGAPVEIMSSSLLRPSVSS